MIFSHIGWLGLRNYQSFDRYWHGDGYTVKTHACNVDKKDPSRFRALCGVRITPGEGSLDSQLSGVHQVDESSRPSCRRCRTLLKERAAKSPEARAKAAEAMKARVEAARARGVEIISE